MITVLIVDDHAIVREGLARLLATVDDVTVLGTASDGAEAAAASERLTPDVVLMDLSMPNVDGVEATRRITETVAGTQIVVLTSFADQRRILDALDAGASGFMLKDAAPDEVVAAIRSAAAGEAPLHPKAARALLDRQRTTRSGHQLSPREREVLGLVVDGLANKHIARRLGISERTVKAHLTNVFQHLGVTDRTQAALWAKEHLAPSA